MDAESMLALIAGLWLMLAGIMAVAWRIEQRTGNSGWVDVVWTSAMALTGITGATAAQAFSHFSDRQFLVSTLVIVWAARLGWHIARRTTSVSDDPRYAKLRQQWGAAASRNMFWLLQAQAALSVPMVLAIALGALNPAPLFTVTGWIAVSVFCLGLAGSTLADQQLSLFKQRNDTPGKVCDTGLWAWSRHPNYFFEWLIWISFAIFAIDLSGAWPWGYIAVAGPACMFWLLRYVSGVPPLEEHMLSKYGAAYAAYQKSTSVFVPLPPTNAS